MSGWKILDHIDERKREQLRRGIVRGEVPSYLNENGERVVWYGGSAEPLWALDLVAKVRGEVADLRRGLDLASAKHERSSVRRRRAA